MTPDIRTFRAADAASALAAVKKALGRDAVILSTRQVSGGLLRKSEIEITAALSPAPIDEPKAPALASVPMTAAAAQAYAPAPAQNPAANWSNSHSPLAEQLLSLRTAVEDVRREIREGNTERTLQTPHIAELISRLEDRGVERAIAEQIAQECLDATDPQMLLARARERIAHRLQPGRAPWRPERRRVIALVGPTGVGKTTTLAKVAARALLESRIDLALITVDTYRIGASDQVARYGEIMNVPTFVARDRGELLIALGKCVRAQLVLVDTAGRSLPEAVAKQAEMIRSVPGIELQLVASAATGARELAATAERYRSLKPERLIFTKLDEAAGPGSMLSAAARLQLPISCVADGQRVPEDLHALTGTELASIVLGDNLEVAANAANR